MKALIGDSIDCVPGINGIGKKIALKLIEKYGSLDAIFDNAENERGLLREKLIEGKESAYIGRGLCTINTSVTDRITLEDFKFNPKGMENAIKEMKKLELSAATKRIMEIIKKADNRTRNQEVDRIRIRLWGDGEVKLIDEIGDNYKKH